MKTELIEKLENLLKTQEEVIFKYSKKDGSERIAKGTRKTEIVENFEATPSGNGSEKSGVITYFDLEKKSWRCFKPENLIEIC